MNNLVKLSDIFEIKYGVNLELINLEECSPNEPNSIPFVSRTEKNNGISAYVYKQIDIIPNPCHTLSLAAGGSVLSTFYQSTEYYSGRDLYILIPKKNISVIEMLYYSRCISANKYKYNYGRQANKTIKDLLIPDCIPNKLKESMVLYKNKLIKQLSKKPLISKKINLDIDDWSYFSLSEIFDITGSRTTPKEILLDSGKGNFPYVTTQETDNGVDGFYNIYTEDAGVLTIDSAVVGHCSYQSMNFSASDHVEKLIPKFKLNKYIATFLVTIINLEKYRYNYGRKASQSRLSKILIKLPQKNGKINFNYMEEYIKSLPFSSCL